VARGPARARSEVTTGTGARASRDTGPGRPRPGPVIQYALLAGPLLSMLDSSIVNVAVELIARGLHADLATVQWTVSGSPPPEIGDISGGISRRPVTYLAYQQVTVPFCPDLSLRNW
jgi:hypothetical protein